MRDEFSKLTVGAGILLIALAAGLAVAQSETAPEVLPQTPMAYEELPSETPATFEPVTEEFDHVRHEAMIPMRDGVKLFTVILVPKGAADAPMLLTRTPYDADALTRHKKSAHLGPVLSGYDNAADLVVDGGYIRVVQDVRGKYGSEGDYVMNRPLRGPQNRTPVDHATDTWDTIDWLVKNVPESNGKVGILHGAKAYLLQDENGQVIETESISAGLDYPAVGPEHCLLKDTGRVQYVAADDESVLNVFELMCKSEGILPALESSHALAYVASQKGKLDPKTTVVINLSGRGDKDVSIVEKHRPVQ